MILECMTFLHQHNIADTDTHTHKHTHTHPRTLHTHEPHPRSSSILIAWGKAQHLGSFVSQHSLCIGLGRLAGLSHFVLEWLQEHLHIYSLDEGVMHRCLRCFLRRGVFAVGFRRFLDWLDWMLPQAWDTHRKFRQRYEEFVIYRAVTLHCLHTSLHIISGCGAQQGLSGSHLFWLCNSTTCQVGVRLPVAEDLGCKAHHYYLSEEKDPDLVEHNFEILRKFPLPSVP